MAEGQGFEPWVPCGTTDFESVTFDLSDTPPEKSSLIAQAGLSIHHTAEKLNPVIGQYAVCGAMPQKNQRACVSIPAGGYR